MTARRPSEQIDLQGLIRKISPLKKAFDLLKDHTIITDSDGRILYANEAAERHTGYSAEEMIGRTPGELWGGHDEKDFYAGMWRTIKVEKKPFVGEMHNKRKDGSWYWQELHISPILDRAGDVKFFIGIEPNITDRKEKETFREEFISVLGHQLRTPAAVIRWTLESLLNTGRLEQEEYRSLKSTYGESLFMIDLIDDLLVLSRLGATDTVTGANTFDLADEIQETIDRVKGRNPRVILTFRKTGGRFDLKANRALARTVFTDILSNAAEYSERDAGRVDVRLERLESSYLLSCENDGLSISAGDQGRIFSKFFRAANALERKEHGSGLGMYIVKMICDSSGWNISFKSPAKPDGTGTIFFLKMPF